MDASAFALLSPEIRNTIYEYVFSTDYAVTLQTAGIQHSLTMTCRRMRDETLGMYLSLTPFNAHLDDGPATPLARWLESIGPEQCLLLREVNIWDMHMLNATLHGVETTLGMLRDGTKDGQPYILRPVGRQMFHRSWYLKDIILPLQSIGIGLERFCIVSSEGSLTHTSHFAITRSGESGESNGREPSFNLAKDYGLSDSQWTSLKNQLAEGRKDIRLLDGRRIITLNFDSTYRVTSMRQEFIPRDEEFYI